VSPAVFLDRDGVLVRSRIIDGKAYAVRRLEEFRLLPGAVDSVDILRGAGYKIVIVTNQPDIGNGLVSLSTVEAMHQRLRRKLNPDWIEMCPHRQDEECACRKPKPGMLYAAAARLSLDLSTSVMIGDRWSDIVAGRGAGCYTILVDRGYKERLREVPNAVVKNLPAAVRFLARQRGVGGACE
jgi:D-glycero-D-manno-heptose 1,7-bisphosphate phosphatase